MSAPVNASDVESLLARMKTSAVSDDVSTLHKLFQEWHETSNNPLPSAQRPAGPDHPLQSILDEAARHNCAATAQFLKDHHFEICSSAIKLAVGRAALGSLGVLLSQDGWDINAPLDQHTPSVLA